MRVEYMETKAKYSVGALTTWISTRGQQIQEQNECEINSPHYKKKKKYTADYTT